MTSAIDLAPLALVTNSFGGVASGALTIRSRSSARLTSRRPQRPMPTNPSPARPTAVPTVSDTDSRLTDARATIEHRQAHTTMQRIRKNH